MALKDTPDVPRAATDRRLVVLTIGAILATAACTGGSDPAPPIRTPADVTVALDEFGVLLLTLNRPERQ